MNDGARHYVHVLLFECVLCGDPIPWATVTPEKNPETVDGHSLPCKCKCGWAGTFLGLNARKHWVERWSENKTGNTHENNGDVIEI